MQRVLSVQLGTRMSFTTPLFINTRNMLSCTPQYRCQSSFQKPKDKKEARFEKGYKKNKKNIAEMLKQNYHLDMASNPEITNPAIFWKKKAKSKRETKISENERDNLLESENVGNLIQLLYGIPVSEQHVHAKHVDRVQDSQAAIVSVMHEIQAASQPPPANGVLIERLRSKGMDALETDKQKAFKNNFCVKRDPIVGYDLGTPKSIIEKRPITEYKPDRSTLALSQVMPEIDGYKISMPVRHFAKKQNTEEEEEEFTRKMLAYK